MGKAKASKKNTKYICAPWVCNKAKKLRGKTDVGVDAAASSLPGRVCGFNFFVGVITHVSNSVTRASRPVP